MGCTSSKKAPTGTGRAKEMPLGEEFRPISVQSPPVALGRTHSVESETPQGEIAPNSLPFSPKVQFPGDEQSSVDVMAEEAAALAELERIQNEMVEGDPTEPEQELLAFVRQQEEDRLLRAKQEKELLDFVSQRDLPIEQNRAEEEEEEAFAREVQEQIAKSQSLASRTNEDNFTEEKADIPQVNAVHQEDNAIKQAETKHDIGAHFDGERQVAEPERESIAPKDAIFRESEPYGNAQTESIEQERLEMQFAEKIEQQPFAGMKGNALVSEQTDQPQQDQIAREQAEAERLQKEHVAMEEAERIALARIAHEESQQLEQDRLMREENKRLEQEKLRNEEAARFEQEQLVAEEAERVSRERLAQEEVEATRIAHEESLRLAALAAVEDERIREE